jgi:hypothetical protein
MTQKRQYTRSQLLAMSEDGIFSEIQLEALLLAGIYQTTRYGKDRRGGSMPKIDPRTGLPISANDLAPGHRATRGVDLVLGAVVNPRMFVLHNMQTDELPENAMRGQDAADREWRSLAYVSPETWSEETIVAVSENTRRLKRLIHRLEPDGLFVTSPTIDEDGNVLGTKNLALGDDRMTMGFAITHKAIQAAKAFVDAHPWYARRARAEESLGKELLNASSTPQWKQADERQADAPIDLS